MRVHRGFTLIEVLIAVLVLGILTAIAVPAYTSYVNDARNHESEVQLEVDRIARFECETGGNSVSVDCTGVATRSAVAAKSTADKTTDVSTAIDAAQRTINEVEWLRNILKLASNPSDPMFALLDDAKNDSLDESVRLGKARDAAQAALDSVGIIDVEAEKAVADEKQRLAEEARLAEEQRLAEEARLAEEQRLAEEARLAEEQRLAEEARLADEQRLAEEARLAEEQRLSERAENSDKIKLDDDYKDCGVESPCDFSGDDIKFKISKEIGLEENDITVRVISSDGDDIASQEGKKGEKRQFEIEVEEEKNYIEIKIKKENKEDLSEGDQFTVTVEATREGDTYFSSYDFQFTEKEKKEKKEK